jgi:hypothetical protein
MAKFILEREGQFDFFHRFLPRINSELSIEEILEDNNDGVLNGNLLEFKLQISDLNSVLFQCIKYLSALRIKGKPIPSHIVLVDLNAETAWVYESKEYLDDIEKVYIGSASKDNKGFVGKSFKNKWVYNTDLDSEHLISLLKTNEYTKIHLDEDCIVGWATSFYKAVPTARKEDFLGDDNGSHKKIGEIREPKVFKDYIYPYEEQSNIKFNYLMDKLNDFLLQKNLGAFYTPTPYVEKAVELVRHAISAVPEGNDYIILDRCAGTGNLESQLSDDELSHCIVSTVEYYEYKVLQELIGAKVRHIVPPTEKTDTFNAGLVNGADALSKEYLDNAVIKSYIDDPHCTIILFENPPYAETTSAEHQKRKKGAASSSWKNSFIVQEMKKEIKGKTKGAPSNDMGNAFIWSAFKYYLRQPTDSYIVFSPVKYWKAQHLIKKKFLNGFAGNRKHFHTNTEACIMIAHWSNVDDEETDSFEIPAYDIDKDGKITEAANSLKIARVETSFSQKYYDKRKFEDKVDGILTEGDGLEVRHGQKERIKPLYNENILGYLVADSSGFDNPDLHSSFLVGGRYNGNGFFVRKDNYLEKLPLFASSRYITYNRSWTERSRIMKSGDGAARFEKDAQSGKLHHYLLKCLLFTTLEIQNHMRTFTGSDGRFYRNELSLDTSNGETIASNDLKQLLMNSEEKALLNQWNIVLEYAKKTENYNSSSTYGVYQISTELDTSYKDELTDKKIWDNIELHSALNTLKEMVKSYYNNEIVPPLFHYEFLK